MELWYIIAGGIAGTFLMTLFMTLASLITGYTLHVPSFLGTMITMSTTPSGDVSKRPVSILAGYTAHYGIGIMFAMAYRLALHLGRWPDTLPNALVFGGAAGVAAVLFWFSAFRLHPLAPAVKLGLYLVLIFIGHFLYAAGMYSGFLLVTAFYNR